MIKKKNDLSDVASERAVLAGLCQYGFDVLLDIDFVNTACFSDSTNQIIFECVRDSIMDGHKVELSSILSKANELGFASLLEKQEEVSYIRSLFNMPVHKDNIPTYAAKLAKLRIVKDIRRTLKACDSKLESLNGNEDISDIMAIIETPIQDAVSEIYNKSSNKPVRMGDDIDDYLDHLADNPTEMVGIPTGFTAFDHAIGGGLRRKCVDVVGARMKVGKTLFGEAVGLHVAGKLGIPVLMMDTEMDKNGHLNRMLANLGNVEINDVQTGRFGMNEIDDLNVRKAARQIKGMPFDYINVSGQPFETILSIARQWIYKEVGFDENGNTKDCLIIYDYLKMMTSDGINESMKEYQALGFQITQLHNFCVKYDVPCLTFIQLNRDGITKESTDVASGSDRILWLCTSFSIFKEKSVEEQADDRAMGMTVPYNRKLVPIISRYGGGLSEGDYINIKMAGKYGRLECGLTRNQLKQSGPINDNPPTDISTV
jgi:replicative DNA helicase